jgi:hypothetical protein
MRLGNTTSKAAPSALKTVTFAPTVKPATCNCDAMFDEANWLASLDLMLLDSWMLIPNRNHSKDCKGKFPAALTDRWFLMHLWDQLIVRATLMLNLPCPLHPNPKVLVHTMLESAFDFNKTLMPPLATKL